MTLAPGDPPIVLFVDDEPCVLRALRRLLRDDRWRLRTAESGAQALKILRTQHVDVIVSDFCMPDMDGVRLLEQVRDDHPAAVRVMLSGDIGDEHLARSTAVAHQWLTKPCPPERIVETLERGMALREMLERDELRAMIGRLGNLPISPRLWTELERRLRDPDATADDVALIVAADAGMATKVLRLVNSAFMGLPRTVASIPEAIVYIGLETLRTLVVSVEIFRTFPLDDGIGRLFSVDALATHGQACSQLPLALVADRATRDHAAAGAVLQNAGQLVHASCDPEGFRAVLDESVVHGRSLHDVEHEMLGFTHADIGAYLLTLWGLPPPIVDTVRLHHTPLPPGALRQPTAREAARMAHLLVQRHQPPARDASVHLDASRIDAELAAAVAPDVLDRWTSAAVASRPDDAPRDAAGRAAAPDGGTRRSMSEVLGS